MRNFHHTWKFSTLTINFSEVWPRQILDLGKQFTLMIRLENSFARRFEDVLKAYWGRIQNILKTSLRHLSKTSWRCLEGVFARRLENVLKRSWRRMVKTNLLVLIKTSWRRLENVLRGRRRKTSSRRLQDNFIKTNVCWDMLRIIGSLNHLNHFSLTQAKR